MKVGSMVRFSKNVYAPADALGILTEVFKYQSGLVRCRVRWFAGERIPPDNLWLAETDLVLV